MGRVPDVRSRRYRSSALAALFVASAIDAHLSLGQEPKKASQATSTDSTAILLAFAVPESPAFTFLGVSPAKVSRASSARDLGAALINGVDSTGKVVNGVALGATLWTLLPNVNIGLTSYQQSRWAYALANSQLSFGTARSSGDTSDTDLAVGIRTTIVDLSDPMRNARFVHSLSAALTDCLDVVRQPNLPKPGELVTPTAVPADSADPTLQCAAAANDSLRLQWFNKNWNMPALSWGVAVGWRAPGSQAGRFDPLGASTWLAASYPLGTTSQLIGQLQFDHRNQRDTTSASDVLTYGMRMLRGDKNHNFFLEVAGTRRGKAPTTVSRSNVQWSAGIEFQMTDGLWLSTGLGRRYAAAGTPDRIVLIANMRWGVSSKSRLRMLPSYDHSG